MRLLLCFALLCGSVVQAAAPAEVLANVYERLDLLTASLSPDGRHLVAVKRHAGTIQALVLDVDAAEVTKSFELTKEAFVAGARIHWLSPQRFIVQSGVRDLVAFNTDGTNVTWIVDWQKPEWVRDHYGPDDLNYGRLGGGSYTPSSTSDRRFKRSPRLVALPQQEPDYAYVEGEAGGVLFGEREDHALFKIHVSTGAVQLVEKEMATGKILHDRQGRPRILRDTTSLPQRYSYRAANAPAGKWEPLERVIAAPDGPHLAWSGEAFFGSRSIPIGFDEDPSLLYIASNVGRETYGVYAIDLRTGRRTSLALEDPNFDLIDPLTTSTDGVLVFDRASRKLAGVRYVGLQPAARWLDQDIQAVHERIAALAPWDNTRIEQWDTGRERFLVRLSRRGDAGAYAMFFRSQDKLQRFIQASSAPETMPRLRTTPWSFRKDSGESLSGLLTLPPAPAAKTPRLVVYFAMAEWSRVEPDFATDVAALARMGFAVLEVNHRGVAGLGGKHWQAGRHNFDVVTAEDALLAVERIGREAKLDVSRIAVFGYGHGGLLALRTAALHPNRIACVAVVQPTLDRAESRAWSLWFTHNNPLQESVESWFFGGPPQRREHSPRHHKEPLAPPLFIAARNAQGFPDYVLEEFVSREKRAKKDVRFIVLPENFYAPNRHRDAFVGLEKFLAQHLPPEQSRTTAQP